ncbi:hypothetical protein ANANG_G00319980 [Anguilla anguilla]|uniref:Uncharacterized protein n=1 Tax=Anguilla anguilla TaxID=7936 RepID=A0A9D3RJC5_ANGAN|nr:hypothetical protein ANANG_G00319980 [Anguilla anguilla]
MFLQLQRMTTQCQAFRMSRRIYAEAMLFCIIVCQYGCSEGVAETATGSTIKGKVGRASRFLSQLRATKATALTYFLIIHLKSLNGILNHSFMYENNIREGSALAMTRYG